MQWSKGSKLLRLFERADILSYKGYIHPTDAPFTTKKSGISYTCGDGRLRKNQKQLVNFI